MNLKKIEEAVVKAAEEARIKELERQILEPEMIDSVLSSYDRFLLRLTLYEHLGEDRIWENLDRRLEKAAKLFNEIREETGKEVPFVPCKPYKDFIQGLLCLYWPKPINQKQPTKD